jgi:lysophospholipase L1-like esterase
MPIEMMAVGDSLYNGVRSLTIDAVLAAHAVPAQVARAFGWDFVSPDYPRPVLLDLEAVFANPLAGTLNLQRNAAANAHAWLADGAWSRQPLFHNLSIAQQIVSQIGTANYADSIIQVQSLAAQGAALPLAQLPVLYQALNTCFVLNPQQTPGNARTAIDILAEAKPKRLLMNIGVNDGLWQLLLTGDATNYQVQIDPTVAMMDLAGKLEQHCRDIEHFYINLLPKPSAMANLMPRTDDENPQGGYYQVYLGRLIQSGGIPGATMREVDTWVNTNLNPRIQTAFSVLGERAHFVDLYAMSAAYDRKNGIATKQVLVNDGGTQILLDNYPLEILPVIGGRRDGGVFGLDNLHPTIVGYGLMAQAVCDVIAATENLARPAIDLQACYDADTLLHNLPPQIALADFVLGFIGAFIPGGGAAASSAVAEAVAPGAGQGLG